MCQWNRLMLLHQYTLMHCSVFMLICLQDPLIDNGAQTHSKLCWHIVVMLDKKMEIVRNKCQMCSWYCVLKGPSGLIFKRNFWKILKSKKARKKQISLFSSFLIYVILNVECMTNLARPSQPLVGNKGEMTHKRWWFSTSHSLTCPICVVWVIITSCFTKSDVCISLSYDIYLLNLWLLFFLLLF